MYAALQQTALIWNWYTENMARFNIVAGLELAWSWYSCETQQFQLNEASR